MTLNLGLDKSIANGIRRVLLNDIPTVGFDTRFKNNDLIMVTNNTSLHNENDVTSYFFNTIIYKSRQFYEKLFI